MQVPATPIKKYALRNKTSPLDDWIPEAGIDVAIEGQFTSNGPVCFWLCSLVKEVLIKYVFFLRL